MECGVVVVFKSAGVMQLRERGRLWEVTLVESWDRDSWTRLVCRSITTTRLVFALLLFNLQRLSTSFYLTNIFQDDTITSESTISTVNHCITNSSGTLETPRTTTIRSTQSTTSRSDPPQAKRVCWSTWCSFQPAREATTTSSFDLEPSPLHQHSSWTT